MKSNRVIMVQQKMAKGAHQAGGLNVPAAAEPRRLSVSMIFCRGKVQAAAATKVQKGKADE